MEKDYIVIAINHADGRSIRIEIPKDGTVNTSIDQVQQWKVVDDANVGEVLETLITGVHIDVKDIEGRIKIEEYKD